MDIIHLAATLPSHAILQKILQGQMSLVNMQDS